MYNKYLLNANKLLHELCIEKEGISLEEFVKKYKFPKKIINQSKKNNTDWYIIDLMKILEILRIKTYDYMVMLEEKLEQEGITF
ncbi:MAG: hypothetical protein NC408_03070 [Candidatus Gastranaerophilales bacterium]|nr:hypothetical protein [Candidatus Gastranaerophilales bacterium]